MFWDSLLGKQSNSNQAGANGIPALIDTLKKFKVDQEDLEGSFLLSESNIDSDLRELVQAINIRLRAAVGAAHTETNKLNLVNGIVHSGLWMMYFDERGEMSRVVWSDEFRRMTGFSGLSDFPNTLDAWTSRLHPDDKDNTLNAFGAAIADKTNRTKYDVQYRLQVKSGDYRWFRAAGDLARYSNGLPKGFLGIFVDITEQKEKDIQLQIETQRLAAIDSTLSEGSWSMSVVGKDPANPANFFWWSQQFRKLLGYHDESDFPNKLDSWSDKLHPDDKQKALDAFTKHVNDYSGRTPFDMEYRLLHKNGSYRWFHAVGKTVRESDGTPYRQCGHRAHHEHQHQHDQSKRQYGGNKRNHRGAQCPRQPDKYHFRQYVQIKSRGRLSINLTSRPLTPPCAIRYTVAP